VEAQSGDPDTDGPARDALTALPTRPVMREQLERSLARARRADRPVALLHADLDEFRLVNESLGHAAGDEVIREVAARLRAADPVTVLAHAEAALRQAKQDGRGTLGFYAGGTTGALARLLLGAQLRKALDEDEFRLDFQPIFSVATGRVAAAEALLRWDSPDR